MRILTESERNRKRYDNLSKEKKDVLNDMALNEFHKPLNERYKAVQLLDFVEFLID